MTYPEDFINKVIQGDCLEILKQMPDEVVDTIITSPPYWGLLDYGVEGQIGLEKTPEEYVEKLVNIFREARRVLKKTGTLWLNLGDSYLLNKNLVGIPWRVAFALQQDGWYLRQDIIWAKPNPMPESVTDRCTKSHEYIFLLSKSQKYYFDNEAIKEPISESYAKDKRPHGITRERFYPNSKYVKEGLMDLQTGEFPTQPRSEYRNKRDVWWITTKPFKGAHFATFPPDLVEPMILAGCPEFVCKKCGKPREKIFETHNPEGITGRKGKPMVVNGKVDLSENGKRIEKGHNSTVYYSGKFIGWTDCGCGAGFEPGIVLDPFMGSGTTAVVSKKLGRNYIGIELNPEYVKIAEERIKNI